MGIASISESACLSCASFAGLLFRLPLCVQFSDFVLPLNLSINASIWLVEFPTAPNMSRADPTDVHCISSECFPLRLCCPPPSAITDYHQNASCCVLAPIRATKERWHQSEHPFGQIAHGWSGSSWDPASWASEVVAMIGIERNTHKTCICIYFLCI